MAAILGAAAAGIWFFLAEAGIVPGIDIGGSVASGGQDTAETPSGPNAEAEAAPAPAGSGSVISGTASVVDADTLDIHGQRMRLNGVDAPESGQKCKDRDGKLYRCGTVAANALDAWINRNPVSCDVTGKDRYGRSLGDCSVRGESVQGWLVANGHALAYRSYSTAFVPAELKAREAKVGVWAGEFISPWDWRQGLRLDGEPPTKAMLDGKVGAR
ncbi:MAG: thermonuclease family protein [Hyphomonadaceae bacterium]|nr:thermonuclease family protein [Hyphomonadaceae bacterium]